MDTGYTELAAKRTINPKNHPAYKMPTPFVPGIKNVLDPPTGPEGDMRTGWEETRNNNRVAEGYEQDQNTGGELDSNRLLGSDNQSAGINITPESYMQHNPMLMESVLKARAW
jgi:hypothetical protein